MIAVAKQTVATGIYDNMARAIYESLMDDVGNALVNYSTLKLFADPPAKARQRIDFPLPPTEALNLGDACHAAVLEPQRFEREFARGINVDRRTTAGKQAWSEFQEAASGKLVLTDDDYATCTAMRDALWNQESLAKSILSAPGKVERSFVWLDQASGMLCKARCDKMSRWNNWTLVIDLKSTRSAALDAFSRDIAKFHYDAQAAFYLDGLATLHPVQRRWFWLAVEKEPPYLYAIYEPTDRLLEQGRKKYRGWMEIYKQCRTTNIWPGYPDGIMPIDVPKWARDETMVGTFE